MKVAIITEIVSPYRTPVFNLLAERPEIDLHVLYLRENVRERSWQVRTDDIRFSYEVLPGWYVPRGGRASPVYFNRRVGRALKRFGPDVTITGGYHHLAAISALRYARRRCDLILWSESTLRDLRPGSRLLGRYKRSYVGRVDRFLVPGTAAREFLVSLGASPDRIWIAPNAVDHGPFESIRKDTTGPFTVLYVGRLIPHKRVGDLISAFAPLDAGGARLLIVGDGAQDADLRRVVDRQGLRHVGFAGFRQPSSLPSIYAQADVLVLPSESDPWGLVVNEAMAAGLPVLVSDAAGAARDLVIDGWNGYTFAPGDTEALGGHLAALADDQTTRERMGKRSRELVARFSPDRSALGFVEAATASPNEVFEEFVRFRRTASAELSLTWKEHEA